VKEMSHSRNGEFRHDSARDLKLSIQLWLNVLVDSGNFPGAIAGIYDRNGDELYYCESNPTYRTLYNGLYSKNKIFRIYSMTKPIVSLGIFILVDRGFLKFEDEIRKFIPAFNETKVSLSNGSHFHENGDIPVENIRNHITVYHLLTHTSGMTISLIAIDDIEYDRINGCYE
jgi:hypothetical protein